MEFWRGMEVGYGILVWRAVLDFCGVWVWNFIGQVSFIFFCFSGSVPLDFFLAGCRFWSMPVWNLGVLYRFCTKIFFRICFSGFFSGLSSCGLFPTRFQFLGPHGPGFFHSPIWNFGPPKPELTLEPWRELAFTATPTSMAAWLAVEDSGRLSRCCSR